MKNLSIIAFLLAFLLSNVATAQVKFGIKAGVSSTSISPDQLLISSADDAQQFGLDVKNANLGINAGIFVQAQIGKFYIQPEVLFNSNKTDYEYDDFNTNNASAIYTESYQNLDIPIMMGAKFGPLRIGAGPVGSVHIASRSELFDVAGYDQKFQEFTYGWTAGLGLDIWKFTLDARYEASFEKYGSHITFFGNDFNFDEREGKFVVNLGYKF